MEIEEYPIFTSPVACKKTSIFSGVSTTSSNGDDRLNPKFSETIVSEFPFMGDDLTYKLGNLRLNSPDQREKRADRFIPMRKANSFETYVPEEK
jgi:hypothetical protein